jgi:hypothetical protein
MTIKKKDGSVYVLKGPNKLLKNQDFFDIKKCIFHNFYWEEIYSENQEKTITKIKKPQTPEPIQHKIKMEEPQPELEFIQTEPEVVIQTEPEKVVESNFPKIKYKVTMHCLPAETVIYNDELYGESKEKITYKDKFIFPSVIINNSDIGMSFWTSDPDNKITKNSIVYPFSYEVYNQKTSSYDKVPFDQYRWWKVIDKIEKNNGWLISSIPSMHHPDFSD